MHTASLEKQESTYCESEPAAQYETYVVQEQPGVYHCEVRHVDVRVRNGRGTESRQDCSKRSLAPHGDLDGGG
ncbi:hypothetical protein RvY_15754-2 [Ramazzottius varieornatus]|uniref:Uncharacterized protein n=1 Tax=Ramazzottius varieornatus TaxID=947166 RepID=A0A1D1VXI5_RAMVA|nr:hypothetical protein RvY_15754-2 [Ramazzottius varieornatus]